MDPLELLGAVCRHLEAHGVRHALIGAGAMSVLGYSRSTLDLDLLCVDDGILVPGFWGGLEAGTVRPDIRDGRGDPTDPLAGLVRFEDDSGAQVDVVVGRHPAWQRPILERATPRTLAANLVVPVVLPADLVALKLFAGSRRDDSDILALLEIVDGLSEDVDQLVDSLPFTERQRWERLRRVQ